LLLLVVVLVVVDVVVEVVEEEVEVVLFTLAFDDCREMEAVCGS
jgi:hypothetical protein